MKVVIVEDEIIAAKTLQKMICEVRPNFVIEAVLQSVEESIEWFESNPIPDLVFMDIHLADGSSFSIFDKVEIKAPIIFTTAYNEYALEAFEVNSIDYLLKPISKQRLTKAIMKFENIGAKVDNSEMIHTLIQTLSEKENKKKTHFLIPQKDKLVPLAVSDIAYLYSEMKIAKAVTFDGSLYSLDYSLDELMKNLDPQHFFRINRQYIVSHSSIKDVSIWFVGKLSINLKVPVDEKIFVSKNRVPEFKHWFTQDM